MKPVHFTEMMSDARTIVHSGGGEDVSGLDSVGPTQEVTPRVETPTTPEPPLVDSEVSE